MQTLNRRSALVALLLAVNASHVVALPETPAPFVAEDAPGRMTLPQGFSATLFAGEPHVLQPIAFTFDARGRMWVAECLSYPDWNFGATPTSKGKDRIIILEDTDNDGRFDKRIVFKDDVENLSGIELGFGGVYVCSIPNFLFIPADVNADEPKPTGHVTALLDGWNVKEVKHNVYNALTWGPDGWLYGLSGIQSKNAVGKPGTPADKRVKFDCGMWRYHPTRHEFEVVTWGTTNPFGLDFDAYGQAFFTNCVIKHLWHAIPGAHYQRMYGQDPYPYVYRPMESCADHIHWGGGDWGSSRGGMGKHSEAGGGHAHVGAMIYLGDNWPDKYRGALFTCNLHGNRVNMDLLEPHGSGVVAKHGPDFMFANDPWFRGLYIKYGPDGAGYVSDWTDTGECHNYKIADRTNGRIYKITFGKTATPKTDLHKLSDRELVTLQTHKNEWFARMARVELQQRAVAGKLDMKVRDGRVRDWLMTMFQETESVPMKLRAMFALHAVGAADEALTMAGIVHTEPWIRSWAIRLELDDRQASDAFLAKLAELAKSDPSPLVRLHLASALQRLSADKGWPIAEALVQRNEDWNDHNLPLMYWFGVEPMLSSDAPRAMNLLKSCKLSVVRESIARRVASEGDAKRLDPLVKVLGEVTEPQAQRDILMGIKLALQGQRRVAMPAGWGELYATLGASRNDEVRETATALALTFGDAQAFAVLRKNVADTSRDAKARSDALAALVGAGAPDLAPVLHELLGDGAVRSPALKALAAAGTDATPGLVLQHYSSLNSAEKQDAIATLSARKPWASALLDAIDAGKVPRTDVSAFTIRQLAGMNDKLITERLEKSWGILRATDKDKAATIAQYKKAFSPNELKKADLPNGRAVFAKSCAQCHTLFGEGGKVGPELTGSQRSNLDYILENMVDPNAAVARDYQMVIIDTKDNRNITGIVTSEMDKALVIRTTNEEITLPKGEIATRRLSNLSMMPEGMLDALPPNDRRDLIAYLASEKQVPMKEK